jgi:hypothetical protein
MMVLVECPFCNEVFEVEQPDKLHTAHSLVNPIPHSYYGSIVTTKHLCPNPNCEKPIVIKWYSPMEYFERI